MQKSMYLFVALLLFSCQSDPPPDGEATTLPSLGQASNRIAPSKDASEKTIVTDDQIPSDAVTEGGSGENPELGEDIRNKMYNELLEGSWESLTETYITLKFEGGKIKRYKDTDLETEEDYRLDFKCTDNACTLVNNPYGVCIVTASNCYSITKIDRVSLQFTSAGDKAKHRLAKLTD